MSLTTPGSNLVNVVLTELSHTDTIAAGNSAELTLIPDNPFIYRIKSVETIINPPAGASAGNNTLIIYYYDGSKNINVAEIISAHNNAIYIDTNLFIGTTSETPSADNQQFDLMTYKLLISNECYLLLKYFNNTDADNGNDFDVKITYEKIRRILV